MKELRLFLSSDKETNQRFFDFLQPFKEQGIKISYIKEGYLIEDKVNIPLVETDRGSICSDLDSLGEFIERELAT
ncbi:MAG: hypothetical protein JW740_02320 [Candidatus Zambryskibacteria bacterium]|nr:hypothetical protein [Candidatus Zambryskibacteria bacterium]